MPSIVIVFTLGGLTKAPVASSTALLAPSAARLLTTLGLMEEIGVAEIDAAVSDIEAIRERFDLKLAAPANCVVVAGKREGIEKIAACVVLSTTRADVNKVVKRRLDVHKASLMPMDRAVKLTAMEYGCITPIGLPAEWPIFIDRRVIETEVVIIGSGVRHSKILLPGDVLGRLPGVQVIDDLATPTLSV
jgi:prolyl-tRNA editing enzyme YbaK/EbsC (Cys-tRNA(Pro) deacylase)